MSNVLERKRSVSKMAVYQNASELRHALSLFLRNDKNVPMKWRALYTFPPLQQMRYMLDCMVKANDIFARNHEELNRRLYLQSQCITACNIIYDQLQETIEDLWYEKLRRPPDNVERRRLEGHITKINNMLDYEIRLLEGWKSSSRIYK